MDTCVRTSVQRYDLGQQDERTGDDHNTNIEARLSKAS